MDERQFTPGDKVRMKGNPNVRGVVVQGPRLGSDGATYQVLFVGQERFEWVPAVSLEACAPEERWVKHGRFLAELAVLKLSGNFADILYSLHSSRTRFLVYQFQPVIKFVQALPHGMLIADEVGLGKTIEAGLILKELVARGSVQRVLVVCPANLRSKWRDEMSLRFGFDFRFIDAEDIRRIRRHVEEGGWPDFFGIASLESLRRGELRQVLEETRMQFDVVIVDEAHHLRNPVTASFELGEVLSEQSDHLLLLSATPVQTGASDLLSLLRLIEPAHFRETSQEQLDELLEPNRYINEAASQLSAPNADCESVARSLRGVFRTAMGAAYKNNPLFQACLSQLEKGIALNPETAAALRRDLQQLHTLSPYFTRTRKREVEESAVRRSKIYRVRLTLEEEELYEAWVTYARTVAYRDWRGEASAWAVSMRERQAASSIQAAKAALEELRARLIPGDIESSEPALEANLGGSVYASLERLRAAAVGVGDTDTKADKLVEIVRQLRQDDPRRKMLVFTFFKGTLRHLKERLSRVGIEAYGISGDDPAQRRAEIVSDFRDRDTVPVLLSTEVGAEGLDFQFCDAVINYDLPWNPMRVEQRIGRIDRFGQPKEVVHVVSLLVENTIDTRILERLYDRIRVFEQAIGELEPILGPEITRLQQEVFSSTLTEDEQMRRAEEAALRVENLRRQMEEFENARASLLGQGDIVRSDIERALRSGRYVSSQELASLVYQWLASDSGGGRDGLDAARKPGVWEMRLSPRSIGTVRDFMTVQRRNDSACTRLLNRIEKERRAWVTFESELAQQYDGLPFLDINHPIVRVALDFCRKLVADDARQRLCALRTRRRDGWPSRAALFVYRVRVTGLEPRDSLLPVAVDMDSSATVNGLGEELLGLVPSASDLPPDDLGPFDCDTLEEIAHRSADEARLEIERWARDTQGARLSTRRVQLQRTYQFRIERKRDTLSKVTEPRIRRLYEGQIANLEATLRQKLSELEGAPEPVATMELVAIAFWQFD